MAQASRNSSESPEQGEIREKTSQVSQTDRTDAQEGSTGAINQSYSEANLLRGCKSPKIPPFVDRLRMPTKSAQADGKRSPGVEACHLKVVDWKREDMRRTSRDESKPRVVHMPKWSFKDDPNDDALNHDWAAFSKETKGPISKASEIGSEHKAACPRIIDLEEAVDLRRPSEFWMRREGSTTRQYVGEETSIAAINAQGLPLTEREEWLDMTGYYDFAYRKEALQRHRKMMALEVKRAELIRESRIAEAQHATYARSRSIYSGDTHKLPLELQPEVSRAASAMPPPGIPSKAEHHHRVREQYKRHPEYAVPRKGLDARCSSVSEEEFALHNRLFPAAVHSGLKRRFEAIDDPEKLDLEDVSERSWPGRTKHATRYQLPRRASDSSFGRSSRRRSEMAAIIVDDTASGEYQSQQALNASSSRNPTTATSAQQKSLIARSSSLRRDTSPVRRNRGGDQSTHNGASQSQRNAPLLSAGTRPSRDSASTRESILPQLSQRMPSSTRATDQAGLPPERGKDKGTRQESDQKDVASNATRSNSANTCYIEHEGGRTSFRDSRGGPERDGLMPRAGKHPSGRMPRPSFRRGG